MLDYAMFQEKHAHWRENEQNFASKRVAFSPLAAVDDGHSFDRGGAAYPRFRG